MDTPNDMLMDAYSQLFRPMRTGETIDQYLEAVEDWDYARTAEREKEGL